MVNIHKISDDPTIIKKIKTTIVQGEITRVPVWKDIMGNEFDNIDGRFIPKNYKRDSVMNVPIQFLSNKDLSGITNHSRPDQEVVADAIAFLCVIGIILLFLIFGIMIGVSKERRKHTLKEMKSIQQVDTLRSSVV